MNTEDILKFENNDGNEVHLVRDRLFWQAWEHSAFLFSKYFRKYQPHHKFVQKVAKDLVYLGFPKNVLSDLQLTSKQKGFVYEVIDDDHIVIRNVPNVIFLSRKVLSSLIQSFFFVTLFPCLSL